MESSGESPFDQLLARVRNQDPAAEAEFLERFRPHILRVARIRLHVASLDRLVEPEDICQSVLANFWRTLGAGGFEFESPERLLGLLSTMVRNQVLKKLEYHRAQRRDVARLEQAGPQGMHELAREEETPSMIVSQAELHARARQLLSDDDLQLLEMRAAGMSWAEIAEAMDALPDRLRKRVARAISRVLAEVEPHE